MKAVYFSPDEVPVVADPRESAAAPVVVAVAAVEVEVEVRLVESLRADAVQVAADVGCGG